MINGRHRARERLLDASKPIVGHVNRRERHVLEVRWDFDQSQSIEIYVSCGLVAFPNHGLLEGWRGIVALEGAASRAFSYTIGQSAFMSSSAGWLIRRLRIVIVVRKLVPLRVDR